MENLSIPAIPIPEPDWYKKYCDDEWDETPWEESKFYQEALAEHRKNNPPEPVTITPTIQEEEPEPEHKFTTINEIKRITITPVESQEEPTPIAPIVEVVEVVETPIFEAVEDSVPQVEESPVEAENVEPQVEPPALEVREDDLTIDIPIHRIQNLVGRDEVVSIKVHGKPVLVNKTVLCEIAGDVPFERINLKSVQESLEENMTALDVEELRKVQTKSVSLGTEYHLVEGTPILDMSQFTVKTPTLATKLRVEIADQDFDLEGFTLLNGVKPEFKDIAKGLERIVKTPVAAHILNMVQEQDAKQEMAFYSLIFDKLEPDANTFTLALGMMRHLMQYALNVDSLQIRSIITEEFINRRSTDNE